MVDVRPAEVEDVPAIRSIATAAWREAHEPIVGADAVDDFLASYYDEDSFRERTADEASILEVATVAGDVVGYAFATPTEDAAWALAQIYVHPDHWGAGVGSVLLERVESLVRDRGGDRITLGVMAENDRAIGFYEAAGFERVDEFYDDRLDQRGFSFELSLSDSSN